MVINEAAGIADHPLTHGEVIESMKTVSKKVARLIQEAMGRLHASQNCRCPLSAAEAGKF